MYDMRSHTVSVFLGVLLAAVLWLMPAPVQAALVSQLDFTSGSVNFKVGSTTVLSGNFTQNGTFVMEQYQPLPNIIPPISINTGIGTFTGQLFTSGPNPFPSSSTSGSTITADLTSLSAGLTGPLLPSGGLSTNIGGLATGSFNSATNVFSNLTWEHILTSGSGLPWTSIQFSLNGTAALVPLPGAFLLFGSGLAGLLSLSRKQAR